MSRRPGSRSRRPTDRPAARVPGRASWRSAAGAGGRCPRAWTPGPRRGESSLGRPAGRPVRSRSLPPNPPGIALAGSGGWGHLTCRPRPWVEFPWPPRFCDAGFRNPRPEVGSPVARAGGNVENTVTFGGKTRNPAEYMWKHAGPRWVNGVDPGEAGRDEVAPHLQYGQE